MKNQKGGSVLSATFFTRNHPNPKEILMSLQEAYKQKAEAELNLAQAKLAEFQAKTNKSTAESQIGHAEQMDNLEHSITAMKEKLNELGSAGEDAWEQLKDGLENALLSLSNAIRDLAEKLKD
jgi:chromosome segregation ATPase